MSQSVGVERETERQREREGEREKETERERDRDRERQRETDIQSQSEINGERGRKNKKSIPHETARTATQPATQLPTHPSIHQPTHWSQPPSLPPMLTDIATVKELTFIVIWKSSPLRLATPRYRDTRTHKNKYYYVIYFKYDICERHARDKRISAALYHKLIIANFPTQQVSGVSPGTAHELTPLNTCMSHSLRYKQLHVFILVASYIAALAPIPAHIHRSSTS